MPRALRVEGRPGPWTRSRMGSRAAYWSRAPAASPASPVQEARLPRALRVEGCSGPRTRSLMGSRAAYWSRAPAASPACPVQEARLPRALRVEGCSGPRTPAASRPACRLPAYQLGQRALDPGTQPLDQPLQVAELRRAHLAGHLIAEPEHQRRPRRILQIRGAHIGNAGPQQRHPRDAALTRPPELQLRDRQALRIIIRGWNPYRCPAISTYKSHPATSSRQLSRTVSLSGR